MPMTHQWSRHSDAIEDARDDHDEVLVSRALCWAFANSRPEMTDLYEAQADVFFSAGNSNAAACATNRALEIIIDAYLDEQKGRVAA